MSKTLLDLRWNFDRTQPTFYHGIIWKKKGHSRVQSESLGTKTRYDAARAYRYHVSLAPCWWWWCKYNFSLKVSVSVLIFDTFAAARVRGPHDNIRCSFKYYYIYLSALRLKVFWSFLNKHQLFVERFAPTREV